MVHSLLGVFIVLVALNLPSPVTTLDCELHHLADSHPSAQFCNAGLAGEDRLEKSRAVRDILQTATARISGGAFAPKDRFPYMVSLRSHEDVHACGAVLVHERAVLTAAHCVHPDFPDSVSQDLHVVVGAYKSSETRGTPGVQVIKVINIHIHPAFSPENIEAGGDIALLELDFRADLAPISIPEQISASSDKFLVLGWGNNFSVLEQLEVSTEDERKCRSTYPKFGDNILCISTDTGDSCNENPQWLKRNPKLIGDSGGPLLLPDAPNGRVGSGNPGRDVLVALTSFGDSDCSGWEKPAGYTLVAPYLRWANGFLSKMNTQYDQKHAKDIPQTPSDQCSDTNSCREENQKLLELSQEGDFPAVQKILEQGVNVDFADDLGQTALYFASRGGHTSIVEALLGAGASLSHSKLNGVSALQTAAYGGHLDVVELLLSKGSNINSKSHNGYTPLHDATINGHLDVTKVLISAGAKVSEAADNGVTPLHNAASKGYVKVVQALLDAGADINSVSSGDIAPLHNTAINGRIEVCRLLVSAGASLDAIDQDGSTALHMATKSNNVDIMNILIAAGAKIGLRDNSGWMPIHFAAFGGFASAVEVLVDAGSDASSRTTKPATIGGVFQPSGRTPVIIAASRGHPEVVKILLDTGASRGTEDSTGKTARDLVPSNENGRRIIGLLG